MRFFAMLDTETVVEIPDATTYEEAAQHGLSNVHWIFTEETLKKFIDSATEAVGAP